MSIESLVAAGLGWLVDASFLGHLPPADQASLLGGASLRDFDRGEALIEGGTTGHGVYVVTAGQAVVEAAVDGGEPQVLARVGPGHLLGERALLRGETTGATVRAVSPVRALYIPADHFSALLRTSRPLLDLVGDLVEVRERSALMLRLLLRDPILRALGRDDLERLMQSGQLIRVQPGASIVRAGELSSDVYLVVSGEVAVYSPATANHPRQLLTTNGSGWLFGHAAVLLELPRTADVEATRTSELLRITERSFMEVVSRNPPLQRRLYQHLASLDLHAEAALAQRENAFVVAVWGARRQSGATTLSYGVSAALRDGGSVTLVDLDGPRSAARLDRKTRRGKLAGIPVVRMQVPDEWNLRVMWPQDRAQTGALVTALRDRARPGDSVVVGLGEAQRPDREVVEVSQAHLYVRWASDSTTDVAIDHAGFRVDAIRLEGDIELPMATTRNTVRMLDDAETVANFWYGRRIEALVDESTLYGRACHRLVRVLHGRTVGIALGGGGALGYAHIGLLQALEENGVPVDYVSGASFGSMVGAMYVGGGLEACHDLVRHRAALQWKIMQGVATLTPTVRWLRKYVGDRTLGSTEIPFLPVSLDIASGQEVVTTRGTITEGFRASSSFPGFFPAIQLAGRRLVDGGICNNVPASVVWDAGASFIIASNIVPPHPVGREPVLGENLRARLRGSTYARLDDLLRAVFLMMSQLGRDRAAMADYVFDFDVEGFNIYDFKAGDAIYREGYRQALAAMPDILYMRETDPSIRVGRK